MWLKVLIKVLILTYIPFLKIEKEKNRNKTKRYTTINVCLYTCVEECYKKGTNKENKI